MPVPVASGVEECPLRLVANIGNVTTAAIESTVTEYTAARLCAEPLGSRFLGGSLRRDPAAARPPALRRRPAEVDGGVQQQAFSLATSVDICRQAGIPVLPC